MFNPFVPADVDRGTDDRNDRLPPAARHLATLTGVTLGTLLPVLMVVANKSAPATLGVAAVCATVSVYLAGYGPLLAERYRRLAADPATLIVAIVVMIGLISLTWSVDPAITRRGLIEAVPELIFALMLAAAWPLVARSRDIVWPIAGLGAAAALIGFEHTFGMPIHALIRARGEAWDLKRSAVPPVLLLWPVLGYCLARKRSALALGLAAAALAGTVVAHSGAPGFALIAAGAFFLLARGAPRMAVGVASALVLSLLVLAPWTGTLAHFLPAGIETAFADEHAAHRIRIWSAFEDRVQDHLIMGHGFNASFRVSQAARPDGVAPGVDDGTLLNNHPHDVFLQVWVELGLLGALAAAGICAFVLLRLGAMKPRFVAPRLALLISVVGIGLVGLSAWQPWWLATIASSLLWFDFVATRFDA